MELRKELDFMYACFLNHNNVYVVQRVTHDTSKDAGLKGKQLVGIMIKPFLFFANPLIFLGVSWISTLMSLFV